MSIKKFYSGLGNRSLNISLFFIVIAVLISSIFIFTTSDRLEMASSLPMFISLIYYLFHLYFFKKATKVTMINKDEQYNTEGPGYLLIEQDSKFIYFFHPGGRAYVKINLKRTIRGIQLTLYEQNNIVEQVVLKHERSNSYIFITNDERVFCRLNFKRNSVYGHIVFPTYTIHFVKQPYQELEFTKKVQQLTVVKKGWLPIEWTSLFRLNTPVICFRDRVTIREKQLILIVAALIYGK